MAEFILFVAIFVGIMAVSALIFGGWFLVMLVRGIATFLGLRTAPPPAIPIARVPAVNCLSKAEPELANP